MPDSLLSPNGLSRTLAMALIHSAHGSLLLLDPNMQVMACSLDFCRAFGLTTDIVGQSLFAVADRLFDKPTLRSLLEATCSAGADVDAYELILVIPNRGMRTLVLNAQKLDYDDPEAVRLLLAIDDVTDARENDRRNDQLVREKAVLLQEAQHRIANSLQIVASVLVQSAKRTQSEESRADLNAAHHRVMSVAAIQRQLAESSLSDVALPPYLAQLCRSIGASMIYDPTRLRIETHIDPARVPAETSVSLGLIVTELVINALKHAYPENRAGVIHVAYRTDGAAWTLEVTDDGVGYQAGADAPQPGLGSAIVQALARNLKANLQVTHLRPGTCVTIRSAAEPDAADPTVLLEAV